MKNRKTLLFKSALCLLLCISMLVGTTFAWFTDKVVSGKNTIAAGNLDVELYHSNAAVQNEQVKTDTLLFKDLQGNPILWEPGVVSYENLRVTNAGDLALAYQLAINTANENFVVDGSNLYGLSQILKVGVVEGGITATDRAGVLASVKDADWTTFANFLRSGSLLPEGAGTSVETWGIVIYWEPGDNDNFWNLNNDKQLSEGDVLSIDLGVNLIATQEMEESDSFNNEYDENAKAEFFPGFQGGSAGAVVTPDDQGLTTAQVAMEGGDVTAVIPAGVLLADGVNALDLAVVTKANSEANIELGENDEMRPLDVHIEGVSQDNTVPMLITLKHYMSTGINTGALKLYHVEDGVPVAMTQVDDPTNHNEFSYDPLTGDVTLAMASFSEVAVVADTENTWNGKAAIGFAGGTGTEADPYQIANADQLAYFRNQVDGGRNFDDEYVMLTNNITLSGVNFDPIGWGYVNTGWNKDGADGKVFMGTFDGNGKVILDLYQSGWDLTNNVTGEAYTYTNCGFGLFAAASNATFKNLTINGANVTVECVEAGVLVGLSQNNCTYDNIKISNAKIANYQRPAGGLIGEVSGDGTTTITNVTIGSDVVVGSLWGDFDAPCGGVIGARWDDAGKNPQIVMTNVEVGARMDVYSDVTSAYQWYAYRRAGMLIGNTEQTAENNQHLAAARFLTCENVKVYYSDWAAYHYCQFTNQDNTWCNNYPWVRVEAGENCSAYSNPRYGQPVIDGTTVSTDTHTCTGEHNMELRFNQLYGGGQGVYGQPAHDGVEVINYRYSITYVNDYQVLAIKYVTESGAVSTANSAAQDLVVKWANENIGEGKFAFGGWMNAGSTKLTQIDANNTENIVLYPYFNKPYTARFVDQQGNVVAYCFFHAEDLTKLDAAKDAATGKLPNPGTQFELDYWEVNANGTKVKYNKDNFANYGYDVTIYPVYRYTGNLKLIPVDEDNDGTIEYYKVQAVSELDVETTIPGYVNGVPVKLVEKLYENEDNTDYASGVKTIIIEEGVEELAANSLAYTSDLDTVMLPNTLEKMGKNAFSRNNTLGGIFGGDDDRKKLAITYNGTRAEWDALVKNSDSDWANGLEKGTTITCTDGVYTATTVYFGTGHKWTWTDK